MSIHLFFYQRDAVLARIIAMALCPSVSVCVCQKSVFYRIGLVFGMGASFDRSYTVL